MVQGLRAGSVRGGSVHGSVGSVTGSDGSVTGKDGKVTGSVGSVHGSVGVVGGAEVGVAVAEKVLPAAGNRVLSSVVRAPQLVKFGIVNVPINFESPPLVVMPCRVMVIGAVKQEVPTMLTGGTVVGSDGSVTGKDGSVVGRDGSVTGSDGSVVGRDGSVVGRDGSVTGSDGSVVGSEGRVRPVRMADGGSEVYLACAALEVEAVTMWSRNLDVAVILEFFGFM